MNIKKQKNTHTKSSIDPCVSSVGPCCSALLWCDIGAEVFSPSFGNFPQIFRKYHSEFYSCCVCNALTMWHVEDWDPEWSCPLIWNVCCLNAPLALVFVSLHCLVWGQEGSSVWFWDDPEMKTKHISLSGAEKLKLSVSLFVSLHGAETLNYSVSVPTSRCGTLHGSETFIHHSHAFLSLCCCETSSVTAPVLFIAFSQVQFRTVMAPFFFRKIKNAYTEKITSADHIVILFMFCYVEEECTYLFSGVWTSTWHIPKDVLGTLCTRTGLQSQLYILWCWVSLCLSPWFWHRQTKSLCLVLSILATYWLNGWVTYWLSGYLLTL